MAGDEQNAFFDRFNYVLGAVALTVFVLLMFDLPTVSERTTTEEILVTVLTGTTLVLALLASGVRRPVIAFALLAAVGFLVWATVAYATDTSSVGFLRWFWFLLVVGTPFAVLRRLVAHQQVTAETLLGAASVYLLIAVAYMFLFLGLDSRDPGSFFGSLQPTTSFMYFSLVTMTTLGYGDLSPATDAARALAVALAVVGQIYLVFIVARMVGLYTRQPRGAAREPEQSS